MNENHYYGWHWLVILILAITILHWHDVHADECSGDTGSSAPPGGTSTSPN